MYTGRLIDELIESVQRAELHAHIEREEIVSEDLAPAYMLEAPYQELLGVA